MKTPDIPSQDTPRRRGFFPMPLGDLLFLAFILAWAVVALLPWAREDELMGVALLGWLMAGLMVLSPVIALGRILLERRRRRRRGGDA